MRVCVCACVCVDGALANGLSRLRPDKLHRRLLLRVINLNFDKHKRAGGQDDYPMPFLFEREHTNWSSYFNERPFGRMPTYNTERDDTGQLGYRYYCALTKRKVDAAVAKIEKEKANLQQKRAREAVKQHEAPSGAQQQSSILPRVVPSSPSSSSSSSSLSSSSSSSYSASAAPLNLVAHNQMMAEVSSSSVFTGISAAEAAARTAVGRNTALLQTAGGRVRTAKQRRFTGSAKASSGLFVTNVWTQSRHPDKWFIKQWFIKQGMEQAIAECDDNNFQLIIDHFHAMMAKQDLPV